MIHNRTARIQEYAEKVLRGARQHVTDSTAMFVVSTPIGAFFETVLSSALHSEMSDESSIKSRLIVGGLYFAGLGGLLGYGSDLSRKMFHITPKTLERYQHFHDMAYLAVATAIVQPPIYLVAGARSFREIAANT